MGKRTFASSNPSTVDRSRIRCVYRSQIVYQRSSTPKPPAFRTRHGAFKRRCIVHSIHKNSTALYTVHPVAHHSPFRCDLHPDLQAMPYRKACRIVLVPCLVVARRALFSNALSLCFHLSSFFRCRRRYPEEKAHGESSPGLFLELTP